MFKSTNETKVQKTTVQSLKKQVTSMSEQLDILSDLNTKLNAQVTQDAKQLSEVRANASALAIENTSLKAAIEKQDAKHENEVLALQDVNRKLIESIEQIENFKIEIDDLKADRNSFSRQLMAAKKENNVSDGKSNDTIATPQPLSNRQKKAKAQLTHAEDVKKINALIRELEAIKNDYKKLEEQITGLKEANNLLGVNNQELVKLDKDQKLIILSFQKKISEFTSVEATLSNKFQQKKEKLQNEIKELQQKLDAEKDQLNNLKKEKDSALSSLAKTTVENENLVTKVKELQQDNSSLRSDLARSKTLSDRESELQDRIDCLQKLNNEKNIEIKRKEQELGQVQASYEATKESNSKLTDQVNEANSLNNQLKNSRFFQNELSRPLTIASAASFLLSAAAGILAISLACDLSIVGIPAGLILKGVSIICAGVGAVCMLSSIYKATQKQPESSTPIFSTISNSSRPNNNLNAENIDSPAFL